jgi:hypothetical protein
MLRRILPRHHRAAAPVLRRLDRAARSLNPYLAVVALGLAILYLICFAWHALPAPPSPASIDLPGAPAQDVMLMPRIGPAQAPAP